VSARQLARISTGKQEPRLLRAAALAWGLETTIDQLFTIQPPRYVQRRRSAAGKRLVSE
jgi:hypothetical protein